MSNATTSESVHIFGPDREAIEEFTQYLQRSSLILAPVVNFIFWGCAFYSLYAHGDISLRSAGFMSTICFFVGTGGLAWASIRAHRKLQMSSFSVAVCQDAPILVFSSGETELSQSFDSIRRMKVVRTSDGELLWFQLVFHPGDSARVTFLDSSEELLAIIADRLPPSVSYREVFRKFHYRCWKLGLLVEISIFMLVFLPPLVLLILVATLGEVATLNLTLFGVLLPTLVPIGLSPIQSAFKPKPGIRIGQDKREVAIFVTIGAAFALAGLVAVILIAFS